MSAEKVFASGEWQDGYSWDIVASTKTPPAELCTAVACVAIDNLAEGTVVMTRNHRGWEVLAGHIEAGESIQDTLRREAAEEGGFIISSAYPFGFRRITNTGQPTATGRKANYPYPTSYIPYFYAFSGLEREPISGEEILESRAFTVEQIEELVEAGHTNPMELIIIKMGLAAARATIV